MNDPRDGQPIGELEPLDAPAPGRTDDPAPQAEVPASEQYRALMEHPAASVWARCYWDSAVPVVLLNTKSLIVWANRSFQVLFGDMTSYHGQPLARFFEGSFDESRSDEMLASIASADRSYSWRGLVTRKNRRDLSIMAHLLILPLYHSQRGTGAPLAYVMLLDDISDYHKRMLRDTFASLLEASKLKDHDTGHHIQRVNAYSRCLCGRLLGHPLYPQVDRQYVEDITFLAAMHDVGKIGISDNILNKNGPLDDWEWTLMKEHTINGAYILSTYPNAMAKDIALFHHEWWDGSGYPYGIATDMIPLAARIVAVADVYDALRMKRSYKESIEHEKTVAIVQQNAGSHLDPELVALFESVSRDFREVFQSLGD
jgi:HD-GYP domain-containing protein (c-di-GMP phosphodiesterase class II)